jgi:hypothetical protein
MAAYSVARSKTATLVASTVDTVTFTDAGQHGIVIVNRSTTKNIHFRLDGVDPALDGDECYMVAATGYAFFTWRTAITEVRLISDGAQKYTVMLVPFEGAMGKIA